MPTPKKGDDMAIVHSEIQDAPNPVTWEIREAQLRVLDKQPEPKIIYDDDAPELTDEELAEFGSWNDVMAEGKARRAARANQTVSVG
jgi:hypothetical protein